MMEELEELVVCMEVVVEAGKDDYMKELVAKEALMEETVEDLELLDIVIKILQMH